VHGELQELYRAGYPYYWHKLDTGEISATCLRSTVPAHALRFAENEPWRLVSIRVKIVCFVLAYLL
jgi:hypothetical protein